MNNDADPFDDNGHGTAVPGIVTSSDATHRGIAWGAKLVSLKTQAANGNGAFSQVDAALDWVLANRTTYGITAVNMSLGTGTVYSSAAFCDQFSTAAYMDLLSAQGVAIFVASGNSGCGTGLSFPACASSAISVGSVYDADLGSPRYWGTEGTRTHRSPSTADRRTGPRPHLPRRPWPERKPARAGQLRCGSTSRGQA